MNRCRGLPGWVPFLSFQSAESMITVCFADVGRVSVRRYVYTMFGGRLEGFSSTLRLQYVWRRRRRNVRRYVYSMFGDVDVGMFDVTFTV